MSSPVAEATPVQAQAVRRVPLQFDENGDPIFNSVTSPECFKVHALGVMPPKHVIPVIFVPGIMGSNLCANGKLTKDGTPAWRPPDGTGQGLREWWKRKKQTPNERQVQMTPDAVRVDDTGVVSIPRTVYTLTKKEAKRRGWGEVHLDSYGGILAELELALNDQYVDAGTQGARAMLPWTIAMKLRRDSGRHDEQIDVVQNDWHPVAGTEVPPLTDDEFRRLGDYYYPVWACGYNWLDSNEVAADRLIKRINEVMDWYKKGKYWIPTGKVIVVTHSMGGLVARRAAQKAGDNILGVVHSVLPVGGAPVVYRRFRAGTEADGPFDIPAAVAATIIGWDAADVTCVLSNSPGPLELLPTKHYPPGWLRFEYRNGKETKELMPALPVSDPYEEIYSKTVKDVWWGMIDENLIDPAGLTSSGDSTPINAYRRVLKTAMTFHDTVQLECHPVTYAHFGSDPKHVSFGRVTWATGDALTPASASMVSNAQPASHTKLGASTLTLGNEKIKFELVNHEPATKDDNFNAGDGTVPLPSGQLITQCSPSPKAFRMTGFDHQMSYGNLHVRENVLYCIGKIVQLATPVAELPQCKE
ncbi:esterase/lipase family protein [Trinickia soli]|uniref:esterase/lipase family protein n=1 Tax=Trinickia soli TaxID=380675 RepID=UPI003FA37184